jgi:rubrerythrin
MMNKENKMSDTCIWKPHKYKAQTKYETSCGMLTYQDKPDKCPFCGKPTEGDDWPSDLYEE